MNVAQKKEFYFYPLDGGEELKSFYVALLNHKQAVSIKGSTQVFLKTISKKVVLATHVGGSKLSAKEEITIHFDLNGKRFYIAAFVAEVLKDDYIIHFDRVFLMLARGFRVPLKDNKVSALFELRQIGNRVCKKRLTVINLSTGGFAIEVQNEKHELFKENDIIKGLLCVGTQAPLEVAAQVKYFKEHLVGCSFINDSSYHSHLQQIVERCYQKVYGS